MSGKGMTATAMPMQRETAHAPSLSPGPNIWGKQLLFKVY